MSPYSYVVPFQIVKDDFRVLRSSDGSLVFSGSQKLCDTFSEQLNNAHEDGYATGKAQVERPRKTTAEKLFPTGRRE